jgi:hypothetical protein
MPKIKVSQQASFSISATAASLIPEVVSNAVSSLHSTVQNNMPAALGATGAAVAATAVTGLVTAAAAAGTAYVTYKTLQYGYNNCIKSRPPKDPQDPNLGRASYLSSNSTASYASTHAVGGPVPSRVRADSTGTPIEAASLADKAVDAVQAAGKVLNTAVVRGSRAATHVLPASLVPASVKKKADEPVPFGDDPVDEHVTDEDFAAAAAQENETADASNDEQEESVKKRSGRRLSKN